MTCNELEEILLDFEINLNNRLLTYVEDDHPVKRINTKQHDSWKRRENNKFHCRRRFRGMDKKTRWKHEYLVALRERHNLSHSGRIKKVKIGDIVMIKGESKSRIHQKIGKVSQLYTGKDEVVRAVQMQVGTKFLVRPIQLVYPPVEL